MEKEKLAKQKAKQARELLAECCLCPRGCGVNRLRGEGGFCGGGKLVRISSVGPHFGEERVLVGRHGSGTIFFAGCSLKCIFCQNYQISHLNQGMEIASEDLAEEMLYLQYIGCHNINLVTPTHFVPQIIDALGVAYSKGLNLPIVYNCGGYESTDVLKLLDGLVDIYMPDLKFTEPQVGEKLSQAPDYYQMAMEAIKEMNRQVGDLELDGRGIAQKGLLLRHLVLPDELAGTEEAMRFIAQEVSVDTYINIMDQYRPCYRGEEIPQINRRITRGEYQKALEIARGFGLHRFAD